MKQLLISLIKFYKTNISPNTNRGCRFEPSCSNYALEVLEHNTIIKSIFKIIIRISKCNPVGPYGYDPVKQKREP